MIARLTIAAVLLIAVPGAVGETLSRSVEIRAKDLLPRISAQQQSAARRAALPPTPLDPALVSGLEQFALDTSLLSRDADAAGVIDLRCIFRGMTEETGVQLDAASKAQTGTEQAAALARLVHMLKDAAEIAPAADGAIAPANRPPGKCKP